MFTLPTFNLNVNIYRLAHRPPASADLAVMGNLAPGRRVVSMAAITPVVHPWPDWFPFTWSHLLLPKLTDVRGQNSTSGHDWVEVPAGSGTYWAVGWVFDSGKGFANEHRVAQVMQVSPYPDPLP